MARVIKGLVNINEVVIDNELYPRTGTFWLNIYKYSENMKAGSKFPPIVLAKIKGKNILVDGRHRLEARKLLKKDKISAILHTDWDRKKVLEEAIKSNIGHGLSLSPYEIRRLVLKLRLLKYKEKDISGLVNVPIGKLEKFVAQRAVSAITGEAIGEQVIVKAPLKHLAGETYNSEQLEIIENSQGEISAKTQINLLDQVIILLENNLIDSKNDKILERIDTIKDLINKI